MNNNHLPLTAVLALDLDALSVDDDSLSLVDFFFSVFFLLLVSLDLSDSILSVFFLDFFEVVVELDDFDSKDDSDALIVDVDAPSSVEFLSDFTFLKRFKFTGLVVPFSGSDERWLIINAAYNLKWSYNIEIDWFENYQWMEKKSAKSDMINIEDINISGK